MFLTGQGAKLLDFGLARQITSTQADTLAQLTHPGAILGTPRYLAPEQWRGEPTDARTDVFAAGAMLYELLVGLPPFDADGAVAAMAQILNQEPPSIGGSPGLDAADRIIQRALSHAPRARYPSAADMADDIRALLVYCAPDAPAAAPEVRAPARSIAVLSFRSAGATAENEEFADGMTEDVIAQLAKIRAIKVIAWASVLPFKKRAQPLHEIAARLGVRTVLDGSVRRAGSRVRIVVQLVHQSNDAHLWSETYDRELHDVFAVQADRAVAIDTNLGDAHIALAFVLLVSDFDWGASEREFRRALELNPGSDFAWAAYGLLLSAQQRYGEAIAAYRRAKELDPLTAVNSSTLASMLLRAGRVEEALEEAARLLELQPEFPMAHSNLGWARLKRGDVAEGLVALEKAVSLVPANPMLLGQLGHAYGITGRLEQARGILARFNEWSATRYVSPYHLAYVHTGLGEYEAAMDCLERAYQERSGGIYGVSGSFLFAGLAAHPRFLALLRKMNLGEESDTWLM